MTASNALFEENHDIFRESVRRFIHDRNNEMLLEF